MQRVAVSRAFMVEASYNNQSQYRQLTASEVAGAVNAST